MTSMSGAFAERIQTTVAYGDQRSSPALAEVRPTSECVRPSILESQISNLKSQISDLSSHVSEIHRRGRGRQLSMARWIDLQQLLRGCARSGRFRNGLSVFVFGFASRNDDTKEQTHCFVLLALFVVNRS